MGDFVYLIGGFGGSSRFNDVWRSADCSHWVQVCKRCSWSPRQGHACTYYKGGLYIMGGFDETGYCNNMYRLPLSRNNELLAVVPFSADSIDDFDMKVADSPFGAASFDSTETKLFESTKTGGFPRVITVSLETTLDSINSLRHARLEHEKTVQGILNIVALVTEAAHHSAGGGKSTTDDTSMLATSSDDFMCGTQEAALSLTMPCEADPTSPLLPRQHSTDAAASRPDSVERHRARSADDMIRVEKRGSPFIMGIMEAGQAARATSAIKSHNDLNMQFWHSLPASSDRIHSKVHKRRSEGDGAVLHGGDSGGNDEDEAARSALEKSGVTLFSSAALRESMERDRGTMLTLQKEIRSAAEEGRIEDMQRAIARRTELAAVAFNKATMLNDYVESIMEIQGARELKLTNLLTRLEDLVVGPNPEIAGSKDYSDSTICHWSDWLPLLDKCTHLPYEVSSTASNAAIGDFRASMRSLSGITRRISEWSSHSTGSQDSISELTGFLDPPTAMSQSHLVQEFESIMSTLARQRMRVKSASDAEIGAIVARKEANESILKEALSKGAGVVLSMLSRNSLDIIEMQTITKEVKEWKQRTSVLKATEELLARQELYLAENTAKEENLLRLEDERIDARSLLEKASLKGSRRPVRSPNTGPVASPALPPIEELTALLAHAERRVKDARRDMRAWYEPCPNLPYPTLP